jgi:hypothetical protein
MIPQPTVVFVGTALGNLRKRLGFCPGLQHSPVHQRRGYDNISHAHLLLPRPLLDAVFCIFSECSLFFTRQVALTVPLR